jgi:hypothetical protein
LRVVYSSGSWFPANFHEQLFRSVSSSDSSA